MNSSRFLARCFHKIVYCLGLLVLAVTFFVSVIWLCAKVDDAISHRSISNGYVASKRYDDGNPRYVSYVFGDLAIVRKIENDPCYYVDVESDGVHDSWTIPKDEWLELSVGDFVSRSDL